jgi:predicted transglutaminase-like cysteine proteinase
MFVCRKQGQHGRALIRGIAAAALSLVLGGIAAAAPAPYPMPLGERTAPPSGFLDFCRRQPGDCGVDLAEVRDRLRPSQSGSSWAWRFAASRQAPGSVYVPQRANLPEDDDVEAARIEDPAMTPELWAVAQRINQYVNRTIIRRSDWSAYGVNDRWATPLSSGQRYGDCEDYALEKRKMLIEAGVPAQALNIALATTRWGDAHAVLLLSAGGGEYVLDNLDAWILPWDQAPYRWRARQVGGDPFLWVRAATN